MKYLDLAGLTYFYNKLKVMLLALQSLITDVSNKKADKTSVYTKDEVYTKTESDSLHKNITDLLAGSYYTKQQIDTKIGDIESALDEIIGA